MSSSQTASSALVGLPSLLGGDDGSGGGGGGDTQLNRTDPDRWYFPKERLDTTPSRKSGIDADKELTYRQQSANFIQDIGHRLQVNQLCINTAIVYMHRFYMFHSFTQFHRNAISAASIFLAAKVEEQPRKLEHVIKVAHYCLHRDHQSGQMDTKSEQYLEQSAELVMNENILLQTLGFDVAIDHPHTHVVKCCQLVRASKDLAQTSYFMATNSLHLTTMCLQYKPTVVACVCIHLACKWSSWEIPRSKEGKDWFSYVDDTVTAKLLEKLTTDFLQIFNKSPSRLKKKIMSLSAASSSLSLTSGGYHGLDSSPHHRSRSPSPKRQGNQKPTNSQPGVPGKPKPPHGMSGPHHPLKMPYPPQQGAPGTNAVKHSSSSHGSSHPPHAHPSGHSSAGKPPHPGMPPGNMKDPHHPHPHSQHPKNPYPPHGHGQHNVPHGQYPHTGRPSTGSSQAHHGHSSMHSKPPAPGSTTSSSHPYSSSSSLKNMQPHNPSNKPPHIPPSGNAKMPPNQVPGAVKNPSQPMFHSSQSHLNKPYIKDMGRPEFGMTKREGPNSSGNLHHSQNHTRMHEVKPMPNKGGGGAPGANDSHVPSKNAYNRPPGTGSTFGQNSQPDIGANKNQGDGFGGEFGSYGSNSTILSIEDRRKRRHADMSMGGTASGSSSSNNSSHNNKRPRTDTYAAAPPIPSLSSNSLFSPEELSESSSASSLKRLPPPTSQFSPSAVEGGQTQTNYNKVPARSQTGSTGTTNAYNGSSSTTDGLVFGSSASDTKPDLRRVNPSMEFQAPDLLQPINDVILKNEPLLPLGGVNSNNNAPRAASLFSPEFNSGPPNISISPLTSATDTHIKRERDPFSNTKLVSVDQQSSSGYSESGSGSQVSFTGRLSSSPKREEVKDDDSHSGKKKKSKKEKHKHKHKDEKKHKKDKHKDKEKEKEKDKKEKHKSKDKHSVSSVPPSYPPPQISNDVSSHKIKIKLGRDDSKGSSVQSASRHSSSKTSNSSTNSSSTSSVNKPLRLKISSNKGRVSSVDDDVKNGPSSDKHLSPDDESTPCCPGFGPCTNCNQYQYGMR